VRVFIILRKGPEHGADYYVVNVHESYFDAQTVRDRMLDEGHGESIILQAFDVLPPTHEGSP